MFKKKTTSRLAALLLALTLLLPISGCAQLPPELAQGADSIPTLLTQAAVWLDDLADLINLLFGSSGSPSLDVPENSSFEVHYIDVGQADCALVICDGKHMIIDGGNAGDSDLVYTYLMDRGIHHLEYMVATHAHEDHIGGLSGAAHASTVGVAYSPVTKYDTKVFKNLVQTLKDQKVSLTVPSPGDTFMLGSAQVEILGPQKDYDETNDTSIVLRVDYGSTSFLFTGDMETTAEEDLLEAGVDLSATVLKVGHHGSSTSTSYPFLREVMPEYAVISVGKGNTYGHPEKVTLDRLKDAGCELYRTDRHGTVIAESDGTTVTFRTEKSGK